MQISKVCSVVERTIKNREVFTGEHGIKGIFFNFIKGGGKCSETARDPELDGKGV